MEQINNFQFNIRVDCLTFNHSQYIEDALNGFCMQKTNFPYLCIIMDDASTDGEQKVISDYLTENFNLDNASFKEENEDYKLIFARHKTNFNCYFAVYFLKYNHYSIKKLKAPYLKENWQNENIKYIALCEGDDYWTDPLKLQKQVDFLESSTEIIYTCHNFKIRTKDLTIVQNPIPNFLKQTGWSIFTLEEAFNGFWFTKTLTCMYRADTLKTIDLSIFKNPKDVHLVYSLLMNGKGAFLNENMGVYRQHDGGVWSLKDSRERFLSTFYTWKDINNKLPTKVSKKNYQKCYYDFISKKLNGEVLPGLSMESYKIKSYLKFPFYILIRKLKHIFHSLKIK